LIISLNLLFSQRNLGLPVGRERPKVRFLRAVIV